MFLSIPLGGKFQRDTPPSKLDTPRTAAAEASEEEGVTLLVLVGLLLFCTTAASEGTLLAVSGWAAATLLEEEDEVPTPVEEEEEEDSSQVAAAAAAAAAPSASPQALKLHALRRAQTSSTPASSLLKTNINTHTPQAKITAKQRKKERKETERIAWKVPEERHVTNDFPQQLRNNWNGSGEFLLGCQRIPKGAFYAHQLLESLMNAQRYFET